MRYEFLIGLRYLLARRRERFVSVIAIISLAGITIGTYTLSVALCVMSGFQKDLRERLLAIQERRAPDPYGWTSEVTPLLRPEPR